MAVKASHQERLWTYAELIAELPETNRPTELGDGELVMVPAPTFQRQAVSQRFEEALRRWVKTHQLGVVAHAPLDVVLAPRRVVQPDILYISNARRSIIRDRIEGAPDLAVEIVDRI
jgi:Uma2 family endonuclease